MTTKTEIRITAKDETRRAFASAKERMTDMDKRVAKLSNSMKVLAGGAAVGAVVAGMSAMVRKSLDAADAIDKQSGAVGLSTEAWQEYVYAASQSGVSQDKLFSGMGALNKRVGELKQGTGSLTTFLKKYDAELYENVKASKSTEEAADLIFKAMGEAETSMDRAALSAAAFSRGAGIEMQNMVRGGAGAVDELRENARKLGLVLDDSVIKKAVTATDELDTMSRIVDAQLNSAMISLAPLLVDAAGKMADIATAASILYDKFRDISEVTSIASLTNQMEGLKDELRTVNEDLGKVTGFEEFFGKTEILEARKQEILEALGYLQHRIAEVKGEFSDLGDGASGAAGGIDEAAGSMDEMAESLKKYLETAKDKKLRELNEQLIDTKIALDAGALSAGEAAKITKNLNAEIDILTKTTKKAKKEVKASLDPMGEYVKSIVGMQEEIDLVNPKLETLGVLFASKTISVEVFTKAVQDLGFETGETAKVVEEEVSAMGEIWGNMVEDVQRAWGDMFSDQFKAVLLDGEASFEDFTDAILGAFVDMIARMAAAWAAEAIFGGGIASANGLFKGLGGAGAGAAGAAAAGGGGLAGLFGGASSSTGAGAAFTGATSSTGAGAASAGIGGSGLLAAGGLAVAGIAGYMMQAANEAERAAVNTEALTATLTGGFTTAESAFLGMSDASTSFIQTLDVGVGVVGNMGTDAEILRAAFESVGVAVDVGNDGLLKMKGSTEKVKAITSAFNSEAASGLQNQIRLEAEKLALMDDGVVRGYHMEEAIKTVTEEFASATLEAEGLVSALNSIPESINTTHTISTRHSGASSEDSYASGTGGWLRVPYDGYSPILHSGEEFYVKNKAETAQSATPVSSGDSDAVVSLLSIMNKRLESVEGAIYYSSDRNVNGQADIKRQLQVS